MIFFDESELKREDVLEGVSLRAVWGERTMMTFFDFKPHAVLPLHKHPHEQITYVVEGEMEFTVNGETRLLKKGQGVVISANQEHGAKVLDRPSKAVDAWYPPREDYKKKFKAQE